MKTKITIVFLFVFMWILTTVAIASIPTTAKGIWIWKIWNLEGGGNNLTTIINRLKNSGVTWVVIKMGDSDSYYNEPGKDLYNWASLYGGLENVIQIFHQNGIKLFGFQYIYGIPRHGIGITEAAVANLILNVPGLDGLIVDAEIEFDTLQNRDVVAANYLDSIRAHHPQKFVGLTSWARVNYHSTFPWVVFLKRVNVNMPQAYWAVRELTPQQEVDQMQSEFAYWTPIWISQSDSSVVKPIVPIGQGGYFGYGNQIYPGDISSFCNVARAYHYQGVSLWAYHIMTPETWDEYATVNWTSSNQKYRLFMCIDSTLVEMDETGKIVARIDSGFVVYRAPVKDKKSNSIWVRIIDKLGKYHLRKYSLDTYKKLLDINLPPSGISWLGPTFAQSDLGDTIFVGMATATFSGNIYKVWGKDTELDGYNLSGSSGSNHRIIVSGWDGRADVISYQKFDNTLVTAGGDVHSFYKFTTSGSKVWSIEGLTNHVITHIASPYENASFTGRNWPELKKISGNGNTIFTVNVAQGGGGNPETSFQPTPDGGLVACVRLDWYLDDIYIRKYSNNGSQIFSISGLNEANNNRDHMCYYDTVNGNTIWLIKKFNQDLYLIKLSGTDSQLQNYSLDNPNGQFHTGFKIPGALTGSVLVIKSSVGEQPTNPSFTLIEPHFNRTASVARGVSDDGSVVVGYSINGSNISANSPDIISSDDNSQRAYRWTPSTGNQDLGTLGLERTWANSVSGDGNVVVGGYYTGSYAWRAFSWTSSTGMIDLGSLGINWVDAIDVSGDGKVIVGYAYTSGGDYGWAVYAFKWTDSSGMVNLGQYPGYSFTHALGISLDGKIIVGTANKGPAPDWHKTQALLWKKETGFISLGTLSNWYSWATGISPDGLAVIGFLQNGAWPEPFAYPYYSFIWKEGSGMINLGTLGGDKTWVYHAVSNNGDLVFGASKNSNGEWRAFVWSKNEGMRDLNVIFGQIIPSGWVLRSVTDCSADGRYLVGIAEGPSGVVRGYILDTGGSFTSAPRDDEIVIPTDFKLFQNYPNPFNPTTKIKYFLPKESFVTVSIYDILGKEITTVVNERKTAGSYEVEFNASNLPSGVYFYRMRAGNFVETKKMVFIK